MKVRAREILSDKDDLQIVVEREGEGTVGSSMPAVPHKKATIPTHCKQKLLKAICIEGVS